MPTHLRIASDVPGLEQVLRHIPDFDLYKLHKITRFMLREDVERGLLLEMDVVHVNRHICSIQLEGVRDLRMPEILMSMPSFSELEVEDVRSRGLEGISYQLADRGPSGGFSCFCHGIRFMRIGILSGEEEVAVLWEAPVASSTQRPARG
jgi:hypothetical protein